MRAIYSAGPGHTVLVPVRLHGMAFNIIKDYRLSVLKYVFICILRTVNVYDNCWLFFSLQVLSVRCEDGLLLAVARWLILSRENRNVFLGNSEAE